MKPTEPFSPKDFWASRPLYPGWDFVFYADFLLEKHFLKTKGILLPFRAEEWAKAPLKPEHIHLWMSADQTSFGIIVLSATYGASRGLLLVREAFETACRFTISSYEERPYSETHQDLFGLLLKNRRQKAFQSRLAMSGPESHVVPLLSWQQGRSADEEGCAQLVQWILSTFSLPLRPLKGIIQ